MHPYEELWGILTPFLFICIPSGSFLRWFGQVICYSCLMHQNPFQNPFQGPVTRYFSIKKKGKEKKHRYSSTMRSTMIGNGKQRTHGMKFHACYGAVHQPCWWVTNLLWPPLGVHNFGLILHQLGCAGGLSDPLPCGVSLKEQWGVTQTQKNIPNSPLRRQNICNCFKVVILLLICDTPLMFAVPLAKQTRPVCSSSC